VTYTLLDAAALATTCPLDLSDPATAPDFVALSFYKIFGFPNIGALIVRKDSAHVLESRKYFGGGTVEMVISINDTWHAKKETSLHDRLEDGTLPFHSIFALDHAMNVHERLYGPNPMKFISHHTAQLGKQLYDSLTGLYHVNGLPLCRIYKDDAAVYGDPTMQGATIAFNVQKSDGTLIGFEEVEEAADHRHIYVRSGSLCNPGGVATYLGWSPAEMKAAYASGHRCSNPTQIMLGKATGVVRVSLGAMSTAGDVQTLIRFLEETYVETSIPRLARSSSLPMLNTSAGVIATYQSRQATTALPLSSESSVDLNGSHRLWESSEAPAMPAMSPTLEADKIRAFIPADYVKRRKPWEEEMRKQSTTFNHGIPGELKMREGEDGGSVSKASTPSFRARKFGRSVVNLLKSNRSNVNINFADQRYEIQ
jgi:molybdenum cofactor sulfurtransferase